MQTSSKNLLEFERKYEINFRCSAKDGQPLEVTAFDSFGNAVNVNGEIACEVAINRPLTLERMREQFSKLGDFVFTLADFTADIEEGISLPISEINMVRRRAVSLLEQKIKDSFRRKSAATSISDNKTRTPIEHLKLSVQIYNEKQLKAFNYNDYDALYVPLSIAVKLNSFTDKTIVVLPRITPDNLTDTLRKLSVDKAMITNIGQYSILKELGIKIYIDHSINIFNTISARYFEDANMITASTELMLSQIRGIDCKAPIEVIAYGRVPLMLTENCIIKSSCGCKKVSTLTDRTGAIFPIICLEGCRNEILNSKPIVMSDKQSDIKNSGINSIRLVFTTEAPDECVEILKHYKNGIIINTDYTRGKFYKGV